MMNAINRKTLLFSAVVGVLMFSIPNVNAITFDEQTCISLLSTDQVKSATAVEQTINSRIINENLPVLNEGMISGCLIGFDSEDQAFSLALIITEEESDSVAQSKYGELFSQSHQSGYEVIEGNNGPWIYHTVEINEKGLGSALLSIKDNLQIGFNAPATDIPVSSSTLIELVKIVQRNIDNYEIEKPDTLSSHLSPMKQIANGIESSNVTCFDGMSLVFKTTDNSPACVKPTTVEKLVERNWAKL